MAKVPSKQDRSESSLRYCLTTERQFCVLSREKRWRFPPGVYKNFVASRCIFVKRADVEIDKRRRF